MTWSIMWREPKQVEFQKTSNQNLRLKYMIYSNMNHCKQPKHADRNEHVWQLLSHDSMQQHIALPLLCQFEHTSGHWITLNRVHVGVTECQKGLTLCNLKRQPLFCFFVSKKTILLGNGEGFIWGCGRNSFRCSVLKKKNGKKKKLFF